MTPRLDAHLHLWDPALGVYSWLTPDLGRLHDRFTPVQARRVLDAAEIGRAVLVQAADAAADTAALLDIAATHPWVTGVVGWIDLEDPDGADAALDRWSASRAFCGVRQLVHDDPRGGVLDLPAVRASIRLLAERNLPLDIPDAFPKDLTAATRLAADQADLVVVLDHLAKPPRADEDAEAFLEWRRQLSAAAAHENVVAKVSGLESDSAPWTVAAVRPAWESALQAFGPRRLMFGSDWPISQAAHGYADTVAVIGDLVDELSGEEQADLWWRTASRTYGLPPDTD